MSSASRLSSAKMRLMCLATAALLTTSVQAIAEFLDSGTGAVGWCAGISCVAALVDDTHPRVVAAGAAGAGLAD